MRLTRIFKFIMNHPLNAGIGVSAIITFLRWQLGSRLLALHAVFSWVNDAKLIVGRGMTAATGNIYVGLMEFEEMAFVLHYLRPADVFYDIGANIGSYTVLASKVVGARTVALEPGRRAFESLLDNIKINRMDDLVIPICMAAGSKQGQIEFSVGKDTRNSVQVGSTNDSSRNIVPVTTLDDIVRDKGLLPHVVKIDVEGFESEVIRGATQMIASADLNVVLMELRGHGFRYGFNERKVHSLMLDNGFKACLYDPYSRVLSRKERSEDKLGDMIYIRDLGMAQYRVRSAKMFRVHQRFL